MDEAVEQLGDSWLVPALAQATAAKTLARNDLRIIAPDELRPPGRPPVLSWDGVSVDFGARRAVNDVSLAVDEGEWVAMIGANGSGKSTLTGLAVGMGTPSTGQVSFRGRPVRPGKVFEQAAHVALLLQAADEMLFEETVIGELKFGSKFRALPPDPVLDVEEAIEFFGFRGLERTSPWELSQGGRQRLALAALLVGAPGVLVLDEPTTGQDAERMRSFLKLLEAVRARTGLTVLTVTHDIRGLAARAARIVLLGDGEVQMDGPTSQVFARPDELETLGRPGAAAGQAAGSAARSGRRRAPDGRRGRGRGSDVPRPACRNGWPAMMSSLLGRTVISYLIVFAVPMVLPVAFIKLVGLGGLRELVTYEAKDTPLHKLDPRLKVLYPIAMGVLSIILNWDYMLIVFGLSLLPWFWLRPSRAKTRVLMVMVIGPALTGFWSQGLYYLPNPPIHFLYQFPWTISWLGSPGITAYGLVFGLEQTARVLVTVSTSMLILVSTDVGDFTWAFERFRMPPQVGFALTAALRFLPDMISRTTLVLRAVELRGYDLSRPRWFELGKWPDYVKRIARCVVLITVPLAGRQPARDYHHGHGG